MPAPASDIASQLFSLAKVPDTPANRSLISGWSAAEGTSAANNPLATTLRLPGSTGFNSVGVQQYPTPQAGAQATAQTLQGYPGIMAALKAGRGIDALHSAPGDFAKWVTGNPSRVSDVQGYIHNIASRAGDPLPASGVPQVGSRYAQEASTSPSRSAAPGLPPAIKAALSELGLPPELGDLLTPPSAVHPKGVGLSYESAAKTVSPSAVPVVKLASQYLGTPYLWGGTTPKGFDCSGFVQYLYGQMGVQLPRVSWDQMKAGTPVARQALEPGDLLFFNGGEHEGLYIGNGQFIHAPHTGDVVKISDLASYPGFAGARRVTEGGPAV